MVDGIAKINPKVGKSRLAVQPRKGDQRDRQEDTSAKAVTRTGSEALAIQRQRAQARPTPTEHRLKYPSAPAAATQEVTQERAG
jgi:hypothetical protein